MEKFKKGIILAGGNGTRLLPMTSVVTKQLFPIYDKPMVYYPLSVFMLLDIRDILFIVKSTDLPHFENLFGDGSHLGLKIQYKVQDNPDGLPQAFTLGEEFIGDDPVTMILGDNIFYGAGLAVFLQTRMDLNLGATVYTFQVKDPERFGVVNYDKDGRVTEIVEKPEKPESNWAMTGFYHFDNDVVEKAKKLKPSARGELEMVDLLREYQSEGRLLSHRAPRGFAWLDTGTAEALLQAATYVEILEQRQGLKIACIEEVAYKKGFIDLDQLKKIAEPQMKSAYGQYLKQFF